MKSPLSPTPLRLGTLALATLLMSGCTVLDPFSGEKVDYKTSAARSKPLEVPPDLSQLSRDSRFQAQGGVISASTAAAAGTAQPGVVATPAVAVLARGDIRVERAGQARWLVVPQAPGRGSESDTGTGSGSGSATTNHSAIHSASAT